MRIVDLLLALLACCVDVVTSRCDYVVTAVGRRVPDWLVLAHESHGNGGSDAAERSDIIADIDQVPCPRVGKPTL